MATLPEDSLTEVEVAALRRDYEAGLCALDVLAARFALSRHTLARLARRLNFGERPPATPFRRRCEANPPHTERSVETSQCDAPQVGALQVEARRDGAQPDAKAQKLTATRRKAPAAGKAAIGETALKKFSSRKTPAKIAQPMKRRVKPAAAARSQSPGDVPALKPLDMAATAVRIQRAAEQELEKIHDRLEAGEDVERRARALSSLVRTLGDLARLEQARAESGAAAGDESVGWTLDDLRAELTRRIDRLEPDAPPAAPSGDDE
jgi:hypothetical protein